MSVELKSMIDGLIDISCRLGEGAVALEAHESIAARRGLSERMADAAASYVALIYAAEASTHVSDLRARANAEAGFSGARRALGELQGSLRLLRGGSPPASTDVERMLALTNEAMALLMAAGVCLRRSSIHSSVRRIR